MVIALKLSKDLNNISLEELISSLESHEIELEEDEPQKKNKSVALKSRSERRKPERNIASCVFYCFHFNYVLQSYCIKYGLISWASCPRHMVQHFSLEEHDFNRVLHKTS